MQDNLIFDLGMHRALDTQFYLKKGFKVVAVEAIETFCRDAENKLKSYLKSGNLIIVNKAVYKKSHEMRSFYINDSKDDWGSLHKWWAEKGGHASREVTVETVSFADLIREHGTPYYVKCDIEGTDEMVVEELLRLDAERPKFFSVESVSFEILAKLAACGYDRFQIVNQALHVMTVPPNPAREGAYADAKFNGLTSGLFGRELPPERWMNFGQTMQTYGKWRDLAEQNIAHGWCDFHATRKEFL